MHTEKQDDLKLNVIRQSMHMNTKITEIPQLPNAKILKWPL